MFLYCIGLRRYRRQGSSGKQQRKLKKVLATHKRKTQLGKGSLCPTTRQHESSQGRGRDLSNHCVKAILNNAASNAESGGPSRLQMYTDVSITIVPHNSWHNKHKRRVISATRRIRKWLLHRITIPQKEKDTYGLRRPTKQHTLGKERRAHVEG